MIDSISTGLAYGSSPYGPSGSQSLPPGMDAAAKALGLTDAQLQQNLQSGSTLSDLAAQSGVSQSSLVSTIAQSLQANAPAGSPAATDSTSLAQSIVQGKVPHHHHGGHHAAPSQDTSDTSSEDDPFGTTADLLGMSQDDLLSSLESGSSFGDLLSAKGLTVNDLTSALGTSQGLVVDTTA